MGNNTRSEWLALGTVGLIVSAVVMVKLGRGLSASLSPGTPWWPLFALGGILGATALLLMARRMYLRDARALAWGNTIVAGLLTAAVIAAWSTSRGEVTGPRIWAAATFAAGAVGIVVAGLHFRQARRSGEAVRTEGKPHP